MDVVEGINQAGQLDHVVQRGRALSPGLQIEDGQRSTARADVHTRANELQVPPGIAPGEQDA